MGIAERFINNPHMSREEYAELLGMEDDTAVRELLQTEALHLRERYFGKKVYIRGLIEFTNYCKNDCYYCGIRCGNRNAKRYRLTAEEILKCCETGHRLGFRTFVLQGGEDPFFTQERMTDLIRQIKKRYPDCALTLSVGEKSFEEYQAYKDAGADRFLLRHETADESHYRLLHPEKMSLSHRMECLCNLKKIGFQTGAGFMVGSPGQTLETLAEDLLFLDRLKPEMVGIGPFIPHHDTRFADQPAGSVSRTLFLLSVIRILLPSVLLPATTALGTLDPFGREKGLAAGANVVMPNLSPLSHRKEYDLYDNKICTGDEAAECVKCLGRRVHKAGFEIVYERGDAPEI